MRSITKTIDYANEKKQLETEYKNKQWGLKHTLTHIHIKVRNQPSLNSIAKA